MPRTRKAGLIAMATIPLWLLLAWLSYCGIGADVPCTGNGCWAAPWVIGFFLIVFMMGFIAAAIMCAVLGVTLVLMRRGE